MAWLEYFTLTRVFMSSTKTILTLSKLTYNITSSASIKEILDLYAEYLIADNQFSLSVIFPILEVRLKDVIQKHSELKSHLRESREISDNLIKKSEDILSLSSAILSVANSLGINSKIHELAKEAAINSKEAYKSFNSNILAMLDHETKILNLKYMLYADIHAVIKDMIEQGLHEADYSKEQLKAIYDQLLAYQQSISGIELRSKVATILKTLYALRKPVENITGIINKEKASNRLQSEELINAANQLHEKLEAILEKFKEFINAIYISEAKQQDSAETITIYQLFLNKYLMAPKSEPIQPFEKGKI
jgi:hypothetical protein